MIIKYGFLAATEIEELLQELSPFIAHQKICLDPTSVPCRNNFSWKLPQKCSEVMLSKSEMLHQGFVCLFVCLFV